MINPKDVFINSCIGIITATSIGTFVTVYEMRTSIATAQNDIARTQKDIGRLDTALDLLRDGLEQNKIEIVRIRTECERWGRRAWTREKED